MRAITQGTTKVRDLVRAWEGGETPKEGEIEHIVMERQPGTI